MLLYTAGVRYAGKIRNENYEILKGMSFHGFSMNFSYVVKIVRIY